MLFSPVCAMYACLNVSSFTSPTSTRPTQLQGEKKDLYLTVALCLPVVIVILVTHFNY